MEIFEMLTTEAKNEVFAMIENAANEGRLEGVYSCDAHNEIFNTDYFIIGTYQAKKWLEENIGVFEAIEAIKEYEQFNFGEVYTDFSNPEKVCNMVIYIAGLDAISEIKTFDKHWDNTLTEKQCNKIAKKANKLQS